MDRLKSVILASLLVLAVGGVAATPYAKAVTLTAESPDIQNLPFKPSADQMADVTATLVKAKASGKLGLVILGANWCHDSRALVRKLNDPVLATVIGDKYETILIDVGELEHGKDVIERFGMPVIYGTPTVLIIDPESEKQLNRHNMHQWRDAYSISLEETIAYFGKMATTGTRGTPAPDPDSSELRTLLAGVDAFEKTQSVRMYKGFALIGPMITMARPERPANFGDLWGELRDYRYQITEDLQALRADARTRVAAGENTITLTYPAYAPFSWEK